MVAEKKTRRIEHKGRVIEIALTDDEFKTWPSDPDLLDFCLPGKTTGIARNVSMMLADPTGRGFGGLRSGAR